MESIDYSGSHLILESDKVQPGEIQWRSPSNIAIVKYWGKHGRQIPRNPSISATLSQAYTETRLEWTTVSGHPQPNGLQLEFLFEGNAQPQFETRVRDYLTSILPELPFLKQLKLKIYSHNSFPHSSGIASSASAMSALALCLCSLEDRLFGTLSDDDAFDRKASYLSRLGSGSAARSIFGHWAMWGRSGELPGSHDEYAIPLTENIHDSFLNMHDAILIVSADEKAVSSSAGHGLMEGHAYASARYTQARQRLIRLLAALRQGEWGDFGALAENEALTLHGLMMCSEPSYQLMQPATIDIISTIRRWREEEHLPVFFTLDAGPNVHVLYPDSEASIIKKKLKEECAPLCQGERIIFDKVGNGPEEL
jgi:diphosphomevalonate decarboxylase